MSERLTSRNEYGGYLYKGQALNAVGLYMQTLISLTEAEDRIAELEAENEKLKKTRDEMTLAAFQSVTVHDLAIKWAVRWKQAAYYWRELYEQYRAYERFKEKEREGA